MLAQHVCNLLDALPKPPWREPLNWNLHMTQQGEERTPFHIHVQRVPTLLSPHASSSFPGFTNLPAELQLRILEFCPAPTLYQLMRTPMLRAEAARLFWADPDTYYLIEASWLFGGGYPGHTCHDMSFMAYVQCVEIDYDPSSDTRIALIRDDVVEMQHDTARKFWETFQKRFPRAKKVVMNQNWESLSILQSDNEPVARCLRVLIEACPAGIHVSALSLVEVSSGRARRTTLPVPENWHRVLYQLEDHDGGWEKVPVSPRTRKTIMMPPKRFSGSVGEFEGNKYQSRMISLQITGLGALAIEALDRLHFDKEAPQPFHCPMRGCNVYLDKAGQWARHASTAHRIDLILASQYDVLPRPLRDDFERRRSILDEKGNMTAKKTRSIYRSWNEEGEEKRRELERSWIHQLENDEAWDTGVAARESILWKEFTMAMNPTWCGQ